MDTVAGLTRRIFWCKGVVQGRSEAGKVDEKWTRASFGARGLFRDGPKHAKCRSMFETKKKRRLQSFREIKRSSLHQGSLAWLAHLVVDFQNDLWN